MIFSHFCGIWLSATLYFLIYCAITKNKPVVYAETTLPGVVSGMIWATAQISWCVCDGERCGVVCAAGTPCAHTVHPTPRFFANSFLGNVIAFPLISIGPGLVSALWAVFVFRELQGRKNYLLVTAAFALIATAATLMALSK